MCYNFNDKNFYIGSFMKELNEQILKYIDSTKEEYLNLHRELAVIPAPSGMEDKRVEFIKSWFEKAGAKQVIVDDAKNVLVPIGCDNKDNIIVFMAHTDVVFPDLTNLPLTEDDEYFYCPGIGDDTSCLILLMMVAKYVIQNNLSSDYGILFVANSCEEGLGNLKGIRQIMKDYANRVETVYTFDGSYVNLVNRSVGSHRYEITFKTEGGHSFSSFGNRNAIVAMSELICNLYKCEVPKKDDTKTTYNVGIVEGGTSVNTICQSAKMLFEYRSNDKECLEFMQNYFNEQIELAKKSGKAEIEVTLVGDRPCGGNLDMDKLNQITNEVVAICKKHSGLDCKIGMASTDANIPHSLGITAVCVGSHISKGSHTREEKLLKSSLPIGFKITAEIILNYFND